MTTTELFEIDNLDTLDSSDLRELADILSQYARYASHKAEAYDARMAGEIVNAMSHEAVCDEIYQAIPQKHRKW